MQRIVLLTGSELRHTFFRKFIGDSREISVVNTYCEGVEKSLRSMIYVDGKDSSRDKHLYAREQSENDMFKLYIDNTEDQSNPIQLPKGDINLPAYTDKILESDPDLLIAYGCSIIKEPLLSAFTGRFLNVHLGLSPYYRGSGTNFWPLVNNEPEYVGATFMHIDAGIDTGDIIHQIRPRISWGDMPTNIGNRLIIDVCRTYQNIILQFNNLQKMEQITGVELRHKVYRNKDYSDDSVDQLYRNFNEGMIEKYLNEEKYRCEKVPIIENPSIK